MPEHSVLAFDFGLARIGCAVGNKIIAVAHPISTITGASNNEKFEKIEELIKTWQPETLVVGLPFHSNGEESDIAPTVRRFARRLHGRFRLPVSLVDERLSSVFAESLLKEAQVFGKKQKAVSDQVAAMAILQTYFSGAITETINEK